MSLSELVAATRAAKPSERVSVGFVTRQSARHDGRAVTYRNHVLSLRVGAAVGSCAFEPGTLDSADEFVGSTITELLAHPLRAVRVAALDAYLSALRPHPNPILVPRGSSLEKSMTRAGFVVDLLPPARRVLVVGVVNSILQTLRARGIDYVPCDLVGGKTEFGEPIHTDARAAAAGCDVLLVSGMTIGNGTFDELAALGKPIVMFAQTGSAIAARLPGVVAVSAEPYPFFWLHGDDSTIYAYGSRP